MHWTSWNYEIHDSFLLLILLVVYYFMFPFWDKNCVKCFQIYFSIFVKATQFLFSSPMLQSPCVTYFSNCDPAFIQSIFDGCFDSPMSSLALHTMVAQSRANKTGLNSTFHHPCQEPPSLGRTSVKDCLTSYNMAVVVFWADEHRTLWYLED